MKTKLKIELIDALSALAQADESDKHQKLLAYIHAYFNYQRAQQIKLQTVWLTQRQYKNGPTIKISDFFKTGV